MLDIYYKQADGTGEIRCKGPNVMLGYLGDAERTQKALRDGWFYTGDLGYLDDEGFLHVIGRRRNAIRVAGGQLVSPEELEVLLSQSPFVREAAVIGAPDAAGKEYEPTARILPNREAFAAALGAEATEELLDHVIGEWIAELNAKLPAHKRLGGYTLVERPFPRDAAGRILRAELHADAL